MSLRDGTKKMSKSDPSDMSRINMTDDADTIAKKIQQGKDRSRAAAERRKGLRRPSRSRKLVGIYAALSGKPIGDVLGEYGGQQFSAFKKVLAEVATEKVSRIGAETAKLMNDPVEIDRILPMDRGRARTIAAPVMDKVKDIVGFIRS